MAVAGGARQLEGALTPAGDDRENVRAKGADDRVGRLLGDRLARQRLGGRGGIGEGPRLPLDHRTEAEKGPPGEKGGPRPGGVGGLEPPVGRHQRFGIERADVAQRPVALGEAGIHFPGAPREAVDQGGGELDHERLQGQAIGGQGIGEAHPALGGPDHPLDPSGGVMTGLGDDRLDHGGPVHGQHPGADAQDTLGQGAEDPGRALQHLGVAELGDQGRGLGRQEVTQDAPLGSRCHGRADQQDRPRRRPLAEASRWTHGLELCGEGQPLVADPFLELGVGDIEPGRELGRGAVELPFVGPGLEHHPQQARIEADPAAFAGDRVPPGPQRLAQLAQGGAQAGRALLGRARAPELVLQPGPVATMAGGHGQQRQNGQGLGRADAQRTPVVEQSKRSSEAQFQHRHCLSARQ